ncbi:MAG: ABC transporter substrate-binding protein [Alcanivoracaceae bacterium]|nr:ABC transporter substrate-binding protein [Alcanivoracaceae bacterium]
MPVTKIFASLLLAFLVLPAFAAEADPHQVIAQSIEKITARIDQERDKIKADPVYARQVVEEEIGGLVDFKRITRLVMANHFSAASKEQKYRFLDVFRESLIATYSSGLTLYEGQAVKVIPAAPGDVNGDKARVKTEIQTNAGKIIPVYFSLYRNGEGHWLVENVIVNGLNLGKTFRSQFDQSVEQYQGDLDQVIANWSSALDVGIKEEGADA